MKVTICELSEDRNQFAKDWQELQCHLTNNQTDLLLLPEMPFSQWLAANKEVSLKLKEESVTQHQVWLKEIEKLNAEYVIYSIPEMLKTKFYNTAYIFQKGVGHKKIHTKALFPEENHFWEETWFNREDRVSFEAFHLDGFNIGVLMCTELWFAEKARNYGKQDVDILLCPRATGKSSVEQWLICGRMSAIVSGAYCLSSNRSGIGDNFEWGGTGWITEPITGNLLDFTTIGRKFVTYSIDLKKSRAAKNSYPLNVTSGFE